MRIYHLIVKPSFDPDWNNRFQRFYTSFKAAGIKTDEKVLFIENDAQIEIVKKLASDNFIEIMLEEDCTNVTSNYHYESAK